jgi:hypothetical protein
MQLVSATIVHYDRIVADGPLFPYSTMSPVSVARQVDSSVRKGQRGLDSTPLFVDGQLVEPTLVHASPITYIALFIVFALASGVLLYALHSCYLSAAYHARVQLEAEREAERAAQLRSISLLERRRGCLKVRLGLLFFFQYQ